MFAPGRLDEGQGIEAAMVANKAKYHKTCRLNYNATMLQKAEKRELDAGGESSGTLHKYPRPHSSETRQDNCFFCQQPPGHDGLHAAATFQLDQKVSTCPTLLQDTQLLRKLSAGDMVAIEAKYHIQCLVGLYNRARDANLEDLDDNGQGQAASASSIAFAKLFLYIEETRQDAETAPANSLAELVKVHKSRMAQLGVEVDNRVHSNRL